MKKRHRSALSPAQQVAMTGLFAATALVLSWLEGMLPPLPVPMARLGLANVSVTAATALLGVPCGAATALCKVLFALMTRGATAALLSGAGTLAAVAVTAALLPLWRRQRLTFVGVSITASAAHTLGQLGAAGAVLGAAVTVYAPWLLLLSLPTGVLTGLVLNITIDRLRSVFPINDLMDERK